MGLTVLDYVQITSKFVFKCNRNTENIQELALLLRHVLMYEFHPVICTCKQKNTVSRDTYVPSFIGG